VRVWAALFGSGYGPVAEASENSNQLSVFIKRRGNFFD
jgi:hypothetical protein